MKPTPLNPQETWVLTANLLISQLILLAIGCVGAIVYAGLATGDWGAALAGFSWIGMIGQSLDTLHDPAMKGEVLRQDIEVPWCGPYEDGKNCTLTDFELRVRDVLRPECVRER